MRAYCPPLGGGSFLASGKFALLLLLLLLLSLALISFLLHLHFLQITALPKEICQLPKLDVLNLAGNKLASLPAECAELKVSPELRLSPSAR